MAKTKALKPKNYSFWDLYIFLNMVHFKNGSVFHSKKNGKKYELQCRKHTTQESILHSILWLSPSFILMYLVVMAYMHFTTAIACIIIFHFVSMYLIMRYQKMWKK